METSTIPPNAPNLRVEEEDALASQVLEVIGGIAIEALQTLEEPEEKDVWPMEEGDDSVFYSDEEQAHQDSQATASGNLAANRCKLLVNSVAASEPELQREDDAGEEVITDKGNSEMEKETTQQNIWTAEEQLQASKTEQMHASDSGEPRAESALTPEKFLRTCGEFLQTNCTTADAQTQPEHNVSADEVNRQVKEEEAVPEAQTATLVSFDVINEESYTRLKREAKVPEQLSSAELQISGDRQLEVTRKTEHDHNFHACAGFHQNPNPGYSSLPLLRKPDCSADQQKAFNHLTSSKYSTVSYRRIRRGNTRQKIEKFEFMLMNQ